jgi:hypothetical protein
MDIHDELNVKTRRMRGMDRGPSCRLTTYFPNDASDIVNDLSHAQGTSTIQMSKTSKVHVAESCRI